MIETVCICGAGTMGSGIAQVAAQAGFYTLQFDVDKTMLEKSGIAIEKSLQQQVDKQKISPQQKADTLSRIRFITDINDCIADVIIEAIVERIDAKIGLFNQLAEINHSETIFATNTSSLSVSDIAAGVVNPARVVGLHFFNPAPAMKLVEVVKAKQTNDAALNEMIDLVKQLQKQPVVCHDAPGFIVNRVARHYYLESMHLVESGITDMETIDKVLETSGFKMGPFKLMDLIGLDINYNVSNIVWNALGQPDRLIPSALQQRKVAANELGRKTGKGFYNY